MLSEYYVNKANVELRENDSRKQQSLEQFREWLSKHKFIKKSRQDDSFLLQFLRSKKYNNDLAYKLYENYFMMHLKYPQFVYKMDERERILRLYDAGYILPLAERDALGRCITFAQVQTLDPDIFTSYDALKLTLLLIMILMEDEQTQICGFVLINHYHNVTSKQMALFSINDVRILIEYALNGLTGRFKNFYAIQAPSFAVTLFNLAKTLLNQKWNQRIFILKSQKEFNVKFDVKLLPAEYGGIMPIQDMLNKFRPTLLERFHLIEQIMDCQIDRNAIPIDKEEISVGSFRKLDID